MSKRIWTVLLVVSTMCIALTGCKKQVGTSEDNAIIDDEEHAESEYFTFGFSCMTMENPYFITLEQALREELEGEGHTLISKDPAMDTQLQNEQIEQMISEGVDAIFLCPVSWEEITPALEKLKQAEVKIINIDSEVKDMDYIDAYVGSDNYEAGVICGNDLMEMCPNGGKIAILESPSLNSVNDRITGFEEAIAGKGFEVAARYDVAGDLNKAREAAVKLFEEHDDLVAVMCGNDQIALGALVAANAGNVSNVMIYGVDGSPDLKKELKKQGTLIRGTCAQSPITMGKDAAKVGVQMLSGESYEKEIYEEVFFINADNVDMYGVDGWQ